MAQYTADDGTTIKVSSIVDEFKDLNLDIPEDVISAVYAIDTRFPDKEACFFVLKNTLNKNEEMAETLTDCNKWVKELSSAKKSLKALDAKAEERLLRATLEVPRTTRSIRRTRSPSPPVPVSASARPAKPTSAADPTTAATPAKTKKKGGKVIKPRGTASRDIKEPEATPRRVGSARYERKTDVAEEDGDALEIIDDTFDKSEDDDAEQMVMRESFATRIAALWIMILKAILQTIIGLPAPKAGDEICRMCRQFPTEDDDNDYNHLQLALKLQSNLRLYDWAVKIFKPKALHDELSDGAGEEAWKIFCSALSKEEKASWTVWDRSGIKPSKIITRVIAIIRSMPETKKRVVNAVRRGQDEHVVKKVTTESKLLKTKTTTEPDKKKERKRKEAVASDDEEFERKTGPVIAAVAPPTPQLDLAAQIKSAMAPVMDAFQEVLREVRSEKGQWQNRRQMRQNRHRRHFRNDRARNDNRARSYDDGEERRRARNYDNDDGTRGQRYNNKRSYNDDDSQPSGNKRQQSFAVSEDPLKCTFFPCLNPACVKEHDENQHKPSVAKLASRMQWSKCCRHDHSEGFCPNRKTCQKDHGKSNNKAERCPNAENGTWCHAYYSGGGCPKSHFRQ